MVLFRGALCTVFSLCCKPTMSHVIALNAFANSRASSSEVPRPAPIFVACMCRGLGWRNLARDTSWRALVLGTEWIEMNATTISKVTITTRNHCGLFHFIFCKHEIKEFGQLKKASQLFRNRRRTKFAVVVEES